MSYDGYYLDRNLKKPSESGPALDLIRGLENRRLFHNAKDKENLELYAEQEFVRKTKYAEMKCELPGTPRSSFLMVFSPDGTKIASTHGNHNIYVSDSRSGKTIKTLVGHPRTPWCIAFHPTSNQIVASGCLGGQVRIWDLSGGSEVWTTSNNSVIASIAFHPNDRVLVIATFNEVYFWDWSKPEPFVQCSTNNPKEKVRYVAFDNLGHKLITGIANSPQTRWERVRAPVPVPRQAERCASPYRRRITPRVVNVSIRVRDGAQQTSPQAAAAPDLALLRRGFSSVPERERRITVCYRNLVKEYEQLVQRYLQLYRPRTMIDRGTDPMENSSSITNSGTQTPEAPSTSRQTEPSTSTSTETQPSTGSQQQPSSSSGSSRSHVCDCQQEPALNTSQSLISPSKIFSVMRKSPGFIRSTQTVESRKHKADDSSDSRREKRARRLADNNSPASSCDSIITHASESNPQHPEAEANAANSSTEISTQTAREVPLEVPSTSRESLPGTSGATSAANDSNVDDLLLNIRRTAEEEVRNRILPIIRSVPENDRPELIRLFENSRENCRLRFRQMYSTICKKPKRWLHPPTNTSSENNSSSDEAEETGVASPAVHFQRRAQTAPTNASQPAERPRAAPAPSGSTSALRNYNTELEQLLTRLLTEIESSEGREARESNGGTATSSFRTAATTTTASSETENRFSTRSTNTVPSMVAVTTTEASVSPMRPPSALHDSSLDALLSDAPTTTVGSSNSRNTFPTSSRLLHFFESLRNDLGTEGTTTTTPSPTVPPTTTAPENITLPPVTLGIGSSSTRTTSSPIYTSNSRRRFFSNRVSAFMPTRVNYTASRLRRSNHLFTRGLINHHNNTLNRSSGPFALDELTNFSERANSEDDPPTILLPSFNSTFTADNLSPRDHLGISAIYSNIVQDLESSLNDVRNITSARPGETSDMLSSFSERLENIMNQSETILRNLRSSMELLSASAEQQQTASTSRTPANEPSWSFNDPSFYVRDARTDSPTSTSSIASGDGGSRQAGAGRVFNPVASDHTYWRDPAEGPQTPGGSESMTPVMITISHIQVQARLLRQQVESIERIDRAMIEVAQLQLVRQLIIELVRRVRNSNPTESARNNAGVSSVRQMMAGTRISDNGPDEAPEVTATEPPAAPSSNSSSATTSARNSEQSCSSSGGGVVNEGGSSPRSRLRSIRSRLDQMISRMSDSSSARTNPPPPAEPSTSSADATADSSAPPRSRPRGSSRKTYPPSRFFKSQRFCRRPSLVHFLSRRYLNRGDRSARQNTQSSSSRSSEAFSNRQPTSLSNYSVINSSTLSFMTRRLESLLTEQMRHFTRPAAETSHRSYASIDLGEHILALRLHGCMLRINRVLGGSSVRPAPPSMAVTADGASRYGARHTLGVIVDGMSRHVEEMGSSSTFSQSMRLEMHGVLAMSLLLSELCLLQVVDSIPPPTGMNLDPERESLTTRIDQMCAQMLQSRFSSHSHQLTRSLRLMRTTMRHAYAALGQTYTDRRNAMLPRHETDRRQLLGSINRCLRTINRNQRPRGGAAQSGGVDGNAAETNDGASTTADANNDSNDNPFMSDWFTTLSDFIRRYSNSNDEETSNNPSTSGAGTGRDRDASSRTGNTSSNNSDDNDDESDWLSNNNTSSHNSNLYRSNNVNLSEQAESNQSRMWTVPSVQVNDVPVSEPSTYQQRLMSQRQRFADRVSEMRHNPSIGGLFRPRFLHPLYANRVNPFDADLDDPQREPIYETDMITTVTPNHRLQAWDISDWSVPAISNSMKNVIVGECKIHNDASVDIAKDGTLLVTLLPSGGYLNVTNRLGVYSLKWETLGQCLYTTSFEQNAVSVSLSPLSRHLLVGLASRTVSIVCNDRWVMARIFKIEQKDEPGDRLPMVRELVGDSRINCIRWLPNSGQGIIYGTNTGQLIVLT
ncbi:unnamed protein product [Brassicogethes aeneus]|uniref:Activating molecule in BECN1-regulated autophagy protein 1 n=1 Tax=Brassicogethes aeneus TaxID=1431903 RepID=A0A9P0B4C2_BRAAE|nr:unnamed protein product [Brassicogethes aeneus]